MPQLKLQKVLSVSSEEKNFPAENLLKQGEFKKWKCVSGEGKAIVTLQLSEASEIEKIDIGNEGSALIEVFVGKSCMKEDDYQVILVASSFMNPSESRNGQNTNRVRLFNKEQLSKSVMDQKWDVVKIVCTQPFNKSVSYGLSFISLHSTQSISNEKQASINLGAFALKPDDDKSTSFKTGSLFERSKHNQQHGSPSISIAATIRDASNSSKIQEQTLSTPKSSRSSISVKSESSEPRTSKPLEAKIVSKNSGASSSTSSFANADRSSSKNLITNRDVVKKSSKNPESKKNSETDLSSGKKQSQSLKHSQDSSISIEPPAKKLKHQNESLGKTKPFNQLLNGVVFILSGFQNPLRGQLRDKALSMGAKYKADWEKGCTHLICAFENTPKYSQVKGQGRIVKKEWIIDSFEKKKLLPWRSYRLGRAPSPQNSQSDQEDDKIDPNSRRTEASTSRGEHKLISCEPGDKKPQIIDPFEAPTDSECETDEEVHRSEKPKVDEPMDDDDAIHEFLPDLPNFLSGLKFFLYGSFTTDDRKCIRRYVTAYDGCLVDYMNDDVTAVITFEKWDENFDKALKDNAHLMFLHPDWLLECIEQQKAVAYTPFIISTP